MAASDQNVSTAKGRLNKGVGEPDVGYITPSDIKTAFDDLQTGWGADITAGGGGGGSNVIVVASLNDVPGGTPAGTVIVIDPNTPAPAPVIAATTDSSYEGTVADWVLDVPAGTTIGDYLVAFLHSQASEVMTSDVSTPAGWDRLGETFSAPTTSERYGAAFGRVVDGTEGATITFTIPGPAVGNRCLGSVVRLTGVDTSNPVAAYTDIEQVGTMSTTAFTGGPYLELTHLGVTCGAGNFGSVSTAGSGTALVTSGFGPVDDGSASADWQHVYQRDTSDGGGGLTWAVNGPSPAGTHMNCYVFRSG